MDLVLPRFQRFTTKVLFYRIPKNASTSIYKHLGFSNVIKEHGEEIKEKVDQRIYKNLFDSSHLKPQELESFNILNTKDYFSFVVSRNPWDRILSMYKFSLLNKKAFENAYLIKEKENKEDFAYFCNILKEKKDDKFFIGCHNQVDWIDERNPPNKILRFENIQKDFSEMVKEINLININPELPHKNKTNHDHYSKYYDRETKKIVFDLFERDIDAFGYLFENTDKNEGSSGHSGGRLLI